MGASFRARPRDYLRLGLMILDEGVNHAGEQVISKNLIAALYADTEKVDAARWFHAAMPALEKNGAKVTRHGCQHRM